MFNDSYFFYFTSGHSEAMDQDYVPILKDPTTPEDNSGSN